MSDKEPVVMSVSEVIRHNVRYYRDRRGWSQRELAERLVFTSGERWTQFRVSDIEGGRKGRDRTISPEELVALSRALDVSVIELMTPPTTVQIGENKGRAVKVRAGVDDVSPDVFFRLAFMLPPNFRRRQAWDLAFAEGPSSQMAWMAGIVREAILALFTEEELRTRFPGVEPLGVAEFVELWRTDQERIADWIADHYGIDVGLAIFDSPRGREWALRNQKEDDEKGGSE